MPYLLVHAGIVQMLAISKMDEQWTSFFICKVSCNRIPKVCLDLLRPKHTFHALMPNGQNLKIMVIFWFTPYLLLVLIASLSASLCCNFNYHYIISVPETIFGNVSQLSILVSPYIVILVEISLFIQNCSTGLTLPFLLQMTACRTLVSCKSCLSINAR